MTLDWIHEIFHESSLVHHQQTQTDHPDHMSALQVLVEKAKQMVVSLELGGETLAEELLAHIRNHLAQMEGDVAQHRATDHNLLLRLVEYLVKWLQREIRHLIGDDIELQRLYILLELGTIGVAGLLRDGVLTHDNGLGALDNEDLREWYKRHGASDVAVDSPPLQGLYDLVFAF
jgi:hypothetical protein